MWHSAYDHAIVAVAATTNLVIAAAAATLRAIGAEVNDGFLVAAFVFVLGTGTGIAGWALLLLIRLSNVVSRLEATTEDHERRISRVES